MIPIIKKELHSYFRSMTGYIFLGFLVLITGIYFSVINILQMVPDYSYVLSGTSILFLILIPVLTMRLFAEEAKQKTDQLLYTAPVAIWKIVFGKFLSALILFLIGMAITAIFPILLIPYGQLPIAKILGAYIGYILLGAAFIGVGMFISVLTDNQIIAAVITFSVLFIFYILGSVVASLPADRTSSLVFLAAIFFGFAYVIYDSTKNIMAACIVTVTLLAGMAVAFVINNLWFDGIMPKIMDWFSLLNRFDSFNKGVLNLADIVYYISFSAIFIYMTVHVIEKRRWR